ncbi:MAG: urease accessory protein UreE [Sarcina sp.]
MLFEKILGSINDIENPEKYHLEKIYLDSDDLLKRIIRVTSDHNHEHGISLERGQKLKDGDILFNDGHNLVVVKVNSEEVLVIKPVDITEMGKIAHKLGNKHLPSQFEGNEMLVQYDYLVEADLKKDGINYSKEKRELKKAFRHVNFMKNSDEHSHGEEHSHNHEHNYDHSHSDEHHHHHEHNDHNHSHEHKHEHHHHEEHRN